MTCMNPGIVQHGNTRFICIGIRRNISVRELIKNIVLDPVLIERQIVNDLIYVPVTAAVTLRNGRMDVKSRCVGNAFG